MSRVSQLVLVKLVQLVSPKCREVSDGVATIGYGVGRLPRLPRLQIRATLSL